MVGEYTKDCTRGAYEQLTKAFKAELLDALPGKLRNPDAMLAFLDLLSEGLTRRQACFSLGLDYTGMQRAYNTIPHFEKACAKAETLFIKRAIESVNKTITGGQVQKVTKRKTRTGDEIVEETLSLPNGELALKALERRDPDNWKPVEKREVEGSMTVKAYITVDGKDLIDEL